MPETYRAPIAHPVSRILLSAFDPFGGDVSNAALDAMNALDPGRFSFELHRIEIPTVFDLSIDCLKEAIQRIRPDAVLCLGQAASRRELTPERVAINLDDARIPDNAGFQPIDRPIFADGENAYFSTLPVKQIVKELRAAGLPAMLSNTAGTFVCNHLMYGLLHILSREYPDCLGGFLHVPVLPHQAGEANPSMPLHDIVRGLEIALNCIASGDPDCTNSEGCLD